jgi:F-type H+-transporting ATPase subunit b
MMSWLRVLIVTAGMAVAAGAFAQTVEPNEGQAVEVDSPEHAVQAAAEAAPAGQPTLEEPHSAGASANQGEHGAEQAAEHGASEHGGFDGKTFALQLLNFGVLLFILIYFGGRAMNKSLRSRHEQLKSEIGQAALLRDQAKQKFDVQEKRIADLEKEIAALRASLRQDAEAEHARLIEGAQEKARRIQDDLRFQLDQQVKEAELHLRAEIATASVQLAEELLRKSVTTDDQRRLSQEFVAGFAGPAGSGGVSR